MAKARIRLDCGPYARVDSFAEGESGGGRKTSSSLEDEIRQAREIAPLPLPTPLFSLGWDSRSRGRYRLLCF